MKTKVFCPGELLIDFICTDVNQTLQEGEHFIKKAGGAPANVAVAVSKLGGQAQFAGCVGEDAFGDFLRETLEREQVDCSYLVHSQSHSTTLAFVSLAEDGQRDFSFVRGADQFLELTKPMLKQVGQSKIAHFGSATGFMGDPLEATYRTLMSEAKKEGVLVSFDPNYRDALFENQKDLFTEKVLGCLKLADLVKVSDEELIFLTGKEELEVGIETLMAHGAQHIVVTLGKKGVLYATVKGLLKVASPLIKAVDTTGAGDAFVGGLLHQLAEEHNPKEVLDDMNKMKKALEFATAVGAAACLKHGAIKSLPTKNEVLELLR